MTAVNRKISATSSTSDVKECDMKSAFTATYDNVTCGKNRIERDIRPGVWN
jgi:hypothetical protein